MGTTVTTVAEALELLGDGLVGDCAFSSGDHGGRYPRQWDRVPNWTDLPCEWVSLNCVNVRFSAPSRAWAMWSLRRKPLAGCSSMTPPRSMGRCLRTGGSLGCLPTAGLMVPPTLSRGNWDKRQTGATPPGR